MGKSGTKQRKRAFARAQPHQQQPPKKKHKANSQNQATPAQQKVAAWPSPDDCMAWLLSQGSNSENNNVSLQTFCNEYLGQKPLLIQRKNDNFYTEKHVRLQLTDIHRILKENELRLGQHIICKAYDGKHEQQIPWIKEDEKINNKTFNKIMQHGFTVQLHHPQHFHENIARLVSSMESFFGVEVGCNVYITPTKQQGLAPHWDDVEVFVLQIEGKKRWKLWERSDEDNQYPLESSGDLQLETDCPDAKLVMECELAPGDLLYFPRGTIHCAKTYGDSHSTHVTISTHQRATWGDFFQTLLEKAVHDAIDEHVVLRRNMPPNFISYMGSRFEDSKDMKQKQAKFMNEAQQLMRDTVMQSLQDVMHGTCDVIAADFVSNRLPPPFMLNAKKKGQSLKEQRVQQHGVKALPTSTVRLHCADWIRMVNDDEFDEDGDGDSGGDGEDGDAGSGLKTNVSVKMVNLQDDDDDDDDAKQADVSSFVDDGDADGDDDEHEDNVNDANMHDGEFRLYSGVYNEVHTHCVEFAEKNNTTEKYVKLPMYLRPVVECLMDVSPQSLSIQQLFEKCDEVTNITMPEIQELMLLLNDMQIIDLTNE